MSQVNDSKMLDSKKFDTLLFYKINWVVYLFKIIRININLYLVN